MSLDEKIEYLNALVLAKWPNLTKPPFRKTKTSTRDPKIHCNYASIKNAVGLTPLLYPGKTTEVFIKKVLNEGMIYIPQLIRVIGPFLLKLEIEYMELGTSFYMEVHRSYKHIKLNYKFDEAKYCIIPYDYSK